jgi:acetyl esterase/lipase
MGGASGQAAVATGVPDARSLLAALGEIPAPAGGSLAAGARATAVGPRRRLPARGLWQALDKGFCFAPLMRIPSAAGHVVLDIAYPLAPRATLEAMDEAVGLALRWLSEAGSIKGVRADRMVLVGTREAGISPWCARFGTRDGGRYAAWSPTALARPGRPPVLQVVGSHNATIPPSQARVLHDALESPGCRSTLVEIPLAVHGFDQYPRVSRCVAPAARRTTATLLAYLEDLCCAVRATPPSRRCR